MLSGVPAEDIDKVWSVVAPLLQRAIDKSQHDYELDDIKGSLHSREMQLWIWVENGNIVACLITMIVNYPRRRVCQMPYIAGRGMADWLKVEPIITAWAKERYCSQLEGFCRPGWVRLLKHWQVVWTTMRRNI